MSSGLLELRLAGYAPPESSHSKALDLIGERMRAALGAQVAVQINYNVMDRGHPAQKVLGDVESGETTLCYFSTSYLVERVPELGIIDLPYAFRSLDAAHQALDGPLGEVLSERTQQATNLVPLGYWDNGFRHLSNRARDIHVPEDCRGLRIRLQPNWIHERFFQALGARPVCNDLSQGMTMLKAGQLDAQENPLANLVAYGLAEIHRHVTLTGHVYGARGVYASASQLAEWPPETRKLLRDAVADAIALQRETAAETERALQKSLEGKGTRFVTLEEDERAAFGRVATPLLSEAERLYDHELWELFRRTGPA